MPNWIEGTMKVRGKKENIIDFVQNGLNKYRFDYETGENVLQPHSFVKIHESEYGTEVDIQDTAYIEGTHRAFVEPCSFYLDGDGDETAVMPFREAWGIHISGFVDLAKRHNVDVRLYGVECGMQFCQELEILDGEVTKEEETHYIDWDWECPFPYMGG